MNSLGRNVGVVGATGLVGETVFEVLAERDVNVGELRVFASEKSEGKTIEWQDRELSLRYARSADDFHGLEAVIVSAGGDKTKTRVSKEVIPMITEAGAIAIDNSSYYRDDPDVPLVVSEVNPEVLDNIPKKIVANPNCTTMIGVVALKPLHDLAGLKSINVSTYQSVSGQGKEGIDETIDQTEEALENPYDFVHGGIRRMGVPKSEIFPETPVLNVVPFCGTAEGRNTTEELKFVRESQKIFGNENLAVQATCTRVLTLNGHSLDISAGFERDISPEEAEEAILEAPGVQLVEVPQPIVASGCDDVLVGRIRKDVTKKNALQLWVSGDNLRKGAALNAVQIVELLANR